VYSIWSFAIFAIRTFLMMGRIYRQKGCALTLMFSTIVDPILYILWLPWNFGESADAMPKNKSNVNQNIVPSEHHIHGPSAPEKHEIYPLL
jgi:hypothetical protein